MNLLTKLRMNLLLQTYIVSEKLQVHVFNTMDPVTCHGISPLLIFGSYEAKVEQIMGEMFDISTVNLDI